jgi:HB1, ASXL, restriction endonuclease HTH domain
MADVDLLSKIMQEIDRRKSDLSELETAARVIQRLLPDSGQNGAAVQIASVPPIGGQNDLAGSTILEACKKILATTGGGFVHFGDVFKEAVDRGYKTSRKKSSEKSVRQSFWAMMKRNEEIFERGKPGQFKLRVTPLSDNANDRQDLS